jgi:AraC-like DNA-binding protein
MDSTTFLILTIIFLTAFFIQGISLFVIRVPEEEQHKEYLISRILVGSAMMMIPTLGILDLIFFLESDNVALRESGMLTFSHLFNMLIMGGLLYFIKATEADRIKRKTIGIGSALTLMGLGAAYTIFQELEILKLVMLCIYICVSIYMYTEAFRSYDRNGLDVKWIPGTIWATYILALLMAGTFFYKELYYVTSIGAIATYIYITMRILNFDPQKHNEREEEDPYPVTYANDEDRPNAINIKRYDRIGVLAKQWVENGLYCNPELSIKDAAAEMGTNTNYLSGYVNKVLNTTFTMWINTLRVEKSKEYLCAGEKMSIEECGRKVGYANIYNYSRWFKMVCGISPSEWRKLNTLSGTASLRSTDLSEPSK